MEFRYNLDRSDVLSWFRYHHKHSPFARRKRTHYIAAWSGIWIGLAIAASCYFQTPLSLVAAIVMAVILSVLARYAYDHQVDRHLQEYVADSQSNDALGEHRLLLSDDCLEEITPL